MQLAIIGLVFVLLVVFSVLAAKTWHWINIVFLLLTFISGVAASAGLAKCLKLRREAMRNADLMEKRAIEAEAKARLAVYGSDDTPGYDPESLRGINEALSNEFMGRGRVWSKGQVIANDANRTFKFSVARGDEAQKLPLQDLFVYAFAESAIGEQIYPKDYVGSFRVISETPEQVELEPVFVANPPAYEQVNTTWSLFEKMPLDRRDAFKKVKGITEDNFDFTEYRNSLVNEYFPAANLGYDLNDPKDARAYERLIDRHTFDGQSLGDINNWVDAQTDRVSATFDPAPEEVFVLYQFENKSGEFDVDAGEAGSVSTDGYFTPLGLAADPALHAGKKISFSKDDIVMVDQLTAEGYQRQDGTVIPPFSDSNSVKEIGRIFRRQLQDYPFLLSDLSRQADQLEADANRVKRNNADQDITLQNAQSQVTLRSTQVTQYSEDKSNFERDLAVAEEYVGSLEKKIAEQEAAIRMLKNSLESQYRQAGGRMPISIGGGGN